MVQLSGYFPQAVYLSQQAKPQDIATLAYIWGYALVTVAESSIIIQIQILLLVQEKVPVNTINLARQLSNTTYAQYVSPNANVLYGNAWLDMAKGPLVLKVPPIPDRYYVFQFMDAFANVFTYVGAHNRIYWRYLSYYWSQLEWTGPNWDN